VIAKGAISDDAHIVTLNDGDSKSIISDDEACVALRFVFQHWMYDRIQVFNVSRLGAGPQLVALLTPLAAS
jgi:hypothetical protein